MKRIIPTVKTIPFKFSHERSRYIFEAGFSALSKLVSKKEAVLITDENVFDAHSAKFRGWNTIMIPAGEEAKTQETADSVIGILVEMEAGRDTVLVAVGGGVVTDLTGYIASIYLRGIRAAFVPTTLLAMTDAAIGGKNGVDCGIYKNIVGTIRQPEFILFDTALLKTLPDKEWSNGFAEIIKHACIKDAPMFRELEHLEISKLQKNKSLLNKLVERNARFKTRVVQHDEFEKGARRLLNFGHTIGHAIERTGKLSHGDAISIGMSAACQLSSGITGFKQTARVQALLQQFNLPVDYKFDVKRTVEVLKHDKKRAGDHINFILLKTIGNAVQQPVTIKNLIRFLEELP